MFTVVESPDFQRLWPRYWDEDERAEFASFIARDPDAGSVIRGSGGVRVVYLTRNQAGEVYLLTIYAKSASENISISTLKEIRRALEA